MLSPGIRETFYQTNNDISPIRLQATGHKLLSTHHGGSKNIELKSLVEKRFARFCAKATKHSHQLCLLKLSTRSDNHMLRARSIYYTLCMSCTVKTALRETTNAIAITPPSNPHSSAIVNGLGATG
jgi:hypothetical protein